MPRGGIPVHQPLASGAIQETHRAELHLGGSAGGLRLLQSRAQCGTLRPVARCRGARFPHVLLCGCNVRHRSLPISIVSASSDARPVNLGIQATDVKAGQHVEGFTASARSTTFRTVPAKAVRRATASHSRVAAPPGTVRHGHPILRIRILVAPACPLGFEVRGLRFGGAAAHPRGGRRTVRAASPAAGPPVGARAPSACSRGEKMLNPVSPRPSLLGSIAQWLS